MYQEYIEIRGARENNLKNVSLRIPKRKTTIFTGVYGSGKSSTDYLVDGTTPCTGYSYDSYSAVHH